MVEIVLNGRLGNQLFMYAAARVAQIETNSDVIYMNTSVLEAEGCSNSLLNYNLPDFVRFYSKPIRTVKNGFHFNYLVNYIYMSYIKKIYSLHDNDILEFEIKNDKKFAQFDFFPCQNRVRKLNYTGHKNALLYGYYQSEKFFEKYRDVIIKEFVPKQDVLNHNKRKIESILNCESVCVSLRLGEDYLKNEMYSVCTKKYFQKAIDYMKENLDNPVFYVFSDVTEGLTEIFGDDTNMVFEEGNDPDYEKLRVMSSCKHFIISNSSFSWWVQYLSDNEKKIVVAPDHWYNFGIKTDIMMDNWVLLET